jgi:hypothetical protein
VGLRFVVLDTVPSSSSSLALDAALGLSYILQQKKKKSQS